MVSWQINDYAISSPPRAIWSAPLRYGLSMATTQIAILENFIYLHASSHVCTTSVHVERHLLGALHFILFSFSSSEKKTKSERWVGTRWQLQRQVAKNQNTKSTHILFKNPQSKFFAHHSTAHRLGHKCDYIFHCANVANYYYYYWTAFTSTNMLRSANNNNNNTS